MFMHDNTIVFSSTPTRQSRVRPKNRLGLPIRQWITDGTAVSGMVNRVAGNTGPTRTSELAWLFCPVPCPRCRSSDFTRFQRPTRLREPAGLRIGVTQDAEERRPAQPGADGLVRSEPL
jgi:hypothetical protein